MQTIYIDVLIVLNIYINFILILATSKITHCKVSHLRAVISALYGSLYSLIILLPKLNSISIFIKLFSALTIVLISFGYHNLKRMITNTVCFFTVNFIFGGFIFAVYIWLKPSFIHFNNTYFYIDFSLLLLIFVTAFLYTVLSIFRYLTDKFSLTSAEYKIIIKYKGNIAVLNGLADTGNSLVDFFSGKPVIICSREKLSESISLPELKTPEDYLKIKGFRIIPYSTIGNSGMIPVFSPDEIMIINDETNYKKRADALIGLQSDESYAIFNPNLLKM